jgi:hypothetical protein
MVATAACVVEPPFRTAAATPLPSTVRTDHDWARAAATVSAVSARAPTDASAARRRAGSEYSRVMACASFP